MRTVKFLIGISLVLASVQTFAGLVDADYQVSPEAFNLRDVSATGTVVPLADDQVSAAVPIGFTFEFFGNSYTQAYISSNGFITFDNNPDSGCCSGDPIPTAGSPDNLVAGFWEDLAPHRPTSGPVAYQTLGVEPNREFIVGFYVVEHFEPARGNSLVTMEMILHEGSNNVELQYEFATTQGEGNHSVGVESAGGTYGTQVDYGTGFTYEGEGFLLTPGGEGEPQAARATFAVQKAYSDDNPDPVAVTLSCNTGLPLEQTFELDPDRFGDTYVEFVVLDFEDGTMDCEITEETLGAYTPSYLFWDEGDFFLSEDSCVFENVEHGDIASTVDIINNMCFIGNTLNESTVTVTKEWIDENPQFSAINYAEASWFCSNIPVDNFFFQLPILGAEFQFGAGRGTGITASGQLEFLGNPGQDSFETLGNWDGGTVCEITEEFVETGVEADDSNCASVVFGPGEDASCTIVNTRLYEGIPTLSQYGLALLAMLMLGMGLVAFRRFA